MSAATVSRYLTRHGLVVPEPPKRPKSSCLRFEAQLPNECWQSDFTHWRLAGGTDTEIICWLDDHSRYVLHLACHQPVTGPVVLSSFRAACDQHGPPASTLTDNGLVYTTRFSGGRGGRNGLEHELRRLGARQKNGRPNHPQTQGKIERFWQTLKKWLAARPPSPSSRPSSIPSPATTTPAGRPVPAPPPDPGHRGATGSRSQRLCRPADGYAPVKAEPPVRLPRLLGVDLPTLLRWRRVSA